MAGVLVMPAVPGIVVVAVEGVSVTLRRCVPPVVLVAGGGVLRWDCRVFVSCGGAVR
jgi:hypothetical protein